jgi:N-acetylmuramoyl-L-alanine amidase CwlA
MNFLYLLFPISYYLLGKSYPKSIEYQSKILLDYISSIHNSKVPIQEITVQAWQGNYKHILKQSLSKYLFSPLNITTNLAPSSNKNFDNIKKPKYYICVHDTGCGVHNAKEWNEAVVNEFIDGNKYQASFQYVVGNDGIYHNIPDDVIGHHAGDGYVVDYKLYDSNVEFNGNLKPIITISNDGYFEIDNVKSVIKAPLKNGEIPLTSDINDQGIRTVVKNGKYYLGETWFSNSFNKVSNHGGNVNSIGIESCVNKGSDIYYTWMKDAKLIAFLMDKYNLGINDVVPHHFFSGKDCPMTMRHSNMYQHVKDLALIEFNILQFEKNGFKISFNCDNKEFVSDEGKVIKIPEKDLNVNYVVTVEKNGIKNSRKFNSIIPGKESLKFDEEILE